MKLCSLLAMYGIYVSFLGCFNLAFQNAGLTQPRLIAPNLWSFVPSCDQPILGFFDPESSTVTLPWGMLRL